MYFSLKNPSKFAIWRLKKSKFSGEGAKPPIQAPPPVGRGTPPPQTPPSRRLNSRAFGAYPSIELRNIFEGLVTPLLGLVMYLKNMPIYQVAHMTSHFRATFCCY